MYINSGNMIMLPTKKAQNLEVVKTPEPFTDRELARAIRDAIMAEEGAIKQYESAADAIGDEKIKEVFNDIAKEEKVHVGELQTLLNDLEPEEEKHLKDGEKEVKDAAIRDIFVKDAQEEGPNTAVDMFIKGLNMKAPVELYKENSNYKIFTFRPNENLDASTLRHLGSATMPIYLGLLDGRMALFVFKG